MPSHNTIHPPLSKPIMDNTEEIQVPEMLVLKFADSKIPVFKETRNKDYIKYGEDNDYPEYLTYLFDKSGKHNAIIGGKARYIFGEGYENGDFVINRMGDTLNDISRKSILDIEIYGGFRWEVIWTLGGRVGEIYHVDYSTIRVGKENGYYWKETWKSSSREQEEFIPGFNPSRPVGSQIFAYNEYRPMVRFYPLPAYIGCNNYVETDIEISKFYLSSIRNGMMPSKMIQFFKGEPEEEKKKEIERRFSKKFAGAENSGKFILVFNDSNATKSVQIDDLSANELDKMFVELNKTVQQEIFSGHLITSPMLFGIKTEGQLGGNTELYTAYAIFQNTYSKPKAKAFSKEVQDMLRYTPFAGQYNLRPLDPIGIQFDVKDVINALPKEFVFTALNIPKEMWGLENIGADNRPTPTTPIAPSTQISGPGSIVPGESAMANDNIKNLTAKQHQQLMRIIRQYGKGQLTEQAAKTLLRTGLGLTDDDINSVLGIQPVAAASFAEQDDAVIAMFDSCGDSKADFEILKSKQVSFRSELEAEGDEAIYIQEAFKAGDVTTTENAILDLIKKDPRVTPQIIAQAIGETKAFVESKIESLTQRGYLESTTETIGTDEIIERTVPKGLDISVPTPPSGTLPPQISIKYSYEGPQDAKNRPFCAKMMSLNRLYSRADIEQISQRLGYSVFDRRGGFWTRKGTNDTTPYCRHKWKSNIVVKKAGGSI